MVEYTLEDFKTQLALLMQPGFMKRMIGLMPGMREWTRIMGDSDVDNNIEQDARRLIGIIHAMTPIERCHPQLIDPSRRKRIAQGSGTHPRLVTALVKQFEFVAPLMKSMAGKGISG